MTFIALILIILSAGLHAAWNFLSKAGTPSIGYFFLTNIAATAATLPFTIFGPVEYTALPLRFWGVVFCSVMCEMAYVTALANGYRKAEISFFYPMSRSLPVVFTFILCSILGIGKTLSAAAMVGMVLVTLGCLILPIQKFSNIRLQDYFNSTMPFVLLGACGTTGYTIFDSSACNFLYAQSGSSLVVALGYLGVIEVGILTGTTLVLCFSAKERETVRKLRGKVTPYLSGIFSIGAYGLVLVAMGLVTNVSFIQAFRQLSLPIGVALGIFVLKERVTLPKILGVATLLAGLILSAVK